jgi:uncharacterized repeat protein (TIGR01451 family)
MLARNQRRRAGATAVLAVLFMIACQDTVSDRTTGLVPGKAAFAAGGNISVNLDQCANNVPRGGNCTWQNGDLNGNNSQYAEGLAIPFRLTIDGLKVGTEYQIHLNYDWTAGGHKSYDFLASDNATETVDICAAGGGGVPSACSSLGTADAEDFPPDDFPSQFQAGLSVTNAILFAATPQGGGFVASGERKLKLYGGTITNISLPTHTTSNGTLISSASSLSGNTVADMLVTFTPTSSSVLFTWSAHLSQSAYWDVQGTPPGSPNGADQISGAPWHMRTQGLQTSSGTSAGNKNQDRSIQPSAILQPPVLDITKTADAATVNAGSTIGYTITVHNTGAGPADGFALSDPLPPGTGISWSIASQSGPVTCAISTDSNTQAQTLNCPSTGTASFPAGGTLTVHVTSATGSASCASYINTATVSLTNGVAPSPASATINVQCPNLTIDKAADALSVNAGSAIGFTITVTNTGVGTASTVTLSDALPTGSGVSWSIDGGTGAAQCSISGSPQSLSCSFGSMASSASKTVHITSSTTALSCGSYHNTATAQATNNAQVSDDATEGVVCGEISLTKVADAATVNAGDQIGFVLVATNAGPGDVTSVVVTDTLPSQSGLAWTVDAANSSSGCTVVGVRLSCTFGTLAASTSKHVHVTSPTAFASCGTIFNRGWVATGNDGTDKDSATVAVQCPSLHITKTADAATVSAGSTVGFTITLSNSGPGTAKSVSISDALPAGSGVSWSISPAVSGCTVSGTPQSLSCNNLGDLASGGSVSVHVTSGTSFASCKAYSNVASAQATNHAVVQSQSVTTTVLCPNLTIDKKPDQAGDAGYTVNPNHTATFTITVSNTGTGTATGVVLTDTLPVAPTSPWVSDAASPPCTVSANAVNGNRDLLVCNIGTLAPNASFTVHLSSFVPANFLFQDPSPLGTPLEIEGNLSDEAGGGKDWATLGISCVVPIAGCDLDRPTGSTDNSFGQGTKEDTPVPSVVVGSIPNNKSDLLRFYVATERFGTHDFLYLAWERVQAPKGTTNMDFELNQSSTLSSNGVTVNRTAGDLLIKYDLASGGGTPVLGYHKWVDAAHANGLTPAAACEAANAFPCWSKVKSLAGDPNVAAAVNPGIVVDPINPNAPRNLDPLTFGEASIDLEGSGIFQSNVCVNFGKAYLKSRSSDSFTAEIKDFIAPIPVSVSNCQNKFLDNKAWAVGTNTGDPVSNTGQIEVTESQSASALFSEPRTRVAAEMGVGTVTGAALGAANDRITSPVMVAAQSVLGQGVVTSLSKFQRDDLGPVTRVDPRRIPALAGGGGAAVIFDDARALTGNPQRARTMT